MPLAPATRPCTAVGMPCGKVKRRAMRVSAVRLMKPQPSVMVCSAGGDPEERSQLVASIHDLSVSREKTERKARSHSSSMRNMFSSANSTAGIEVEKDSEKRVTHFVMG